MDIKHIIITSALLLNGCTWFKSPQPDMRVIIDACASSYVDRVRAADNNSSIDVKCQNQNVMRIMPFKP